MKSWNGRKMEIETWVMRLDWSTAGSGVTATRRGAKSPCPWVIVTCSVKASSSTGAIMMNEDEDEEEAIVGISCIHEAQSSSLQYA